MRASKRERKYAIITHKHTNTYSHNTHTNICSHKHTLTQTYSQNLHTHLLIQHTHILTQHTFTHNLCRATGI